MSARETLDRLGRRMRDFWQRVTEGLQLEDLWTQFKSEARASYGFYSQDVDWEAVNRATQWQRPFYIARALFWALILKLSPARRVLLLLAIAMLVGRASCRGRGEISVGAGSFKKKKKR